MNKKEVEEISITETIVKHLSNGPDFTGDWEMEATIDFLLDKPIQFQVFCDVFTIDRIRLFYDGFGVSLYYADEKKHFLRPLTVSKIFVKKVYDELSIVQKEEQFKEYNFLDDLRDMLRGEREVCAW